MKRLPLLVLTGGVSGALLVPSFAVPRPAGDDGLELLRQAADAAGKISFHGTQVVTLWSPAGTTAAVVDVTHNPGEGSVLRVQPNASQPGRVYVDHAETQNAAGLTADLLGRIAANYETEVVGFDMVAGRPVDVVAVRVPGGPDVARYWLDKALHLVLRRESLDGAGRTVRESVFIDIDFVAVALPRMAYAEQLPSAGGQATPVTLLAGAGWQVPEPPARLTLLEARASGAGRDRVVHLTFSDGMSSVSLFQQRGRLDRETVRGWTRTRLGGAKVWVERGLPTRVVWSSRGTVYTVVADCPDPVLTGFVQLLPHGERRRNLAARLGRGLARVGSWFNPFA